MDETADRPQMPVLYTKPIAIDRQAHAGKHFVPPKDLRFARGATHVPLGMAELAFAARHYPIVFPTAAPAGPLAILGLEPGKNLFVDAAGRWAEDHYIPAYIRRFPFVFTTATDGQFILCVEETAAALADSGDAPLFQPDGTPGKIVEEALRFSGDFHAQVTLGQAFGDALNAQNLLFENRAQAKLPGGRDFTLQGFRTLDAAKFDQLADDVYLDWRKKGFVAAVHCHLLSLGNWQVLANRAARTSKAA
ncbi:MAG: SapC family protein [Azospirillum sp.]|jgi:hypothetical protein|nr:SapC family protein [Azospirillum sp.]MCZ8123149.1 SapC family protein [Magnetospirillum sp.]